MGGEGHNSTASNAVAAASTTAPVIPSYFNNETHQGWLYAHIATMVLAWVVVLPIGKEEECPDSLNTPPKSNMIVQESCSQSPDPS